MPSTSTATNDAREPTAEAAAGRLIALLHAVGGCSHSLRTAIDDLASAQEMNATQLTVLWACGASAEGIGQTHLAAHIGVSPAQASALVEQLRQRNLLESRRATDDRRRQQWSLTATGRKVIDDATQGLAAIEARVSKGRENRAHGLCDQLAQLADSLQRTKSQIAGDAFPRLYDDIETVAERSAGPGQGAKCPAPKQQEVRR
jgi:DNA-binding MarR family transcriptional regulator